MSMIHCTMASIMNIQQQENESDYGVFAIAFTKCSLEVKDPSEYDFVNHGKHLAQYLPPEFPTVFAEHIPNVLNRVLHIQLKPVPKNIKKHEVDFLCFIFVNVFLCVVEFV